MSMDSQQDVRDVLSRTVRIESELYTLKQSTQMLHNSQAQLFQAVQHAIALIGNIQPQSQLQGTHRCDETTQQPNAPIAAIATQRTDVEVEPMAPTLANSTLLQSSQEKNGLCPFIGCTATVHSCSAVKSLRHMQTCVYCPDPFYRYLHIAEHMSTFQKHPKVTSSEVCCWCAVHFDHAQSPDARSRHRFACRDKAKLSLEVTFVICVNTQALISDTIWQDPNTCLSMTNRLEACWAASNVIEPSPIKRNRSTSEAFSPPLAPGVNVPPVRMAATFLQFPYHSDN